MTSVVDTLRRAAADAAMWRARLEVRAAEDARAGSQGHPHPEDDVVSSRAWTGGSDRRWRRARERQLAEFPVCRPCEERGRGEVAVEVHHVVPLAAGGHRYDPDNLLSVCSTCHDALHGARIRGCDVDGNPLDPRARARWFARDP